MTRPVLLGDPPADFLATVHPSKRALVAQLAAGGATSAPTASPVEVVGVRYGWARSISPADPAGSNHAAKPQEDKMPFPEHASLTREGRAAAAFRSLPAPLRAHVTSPRHLEMLRGIYGGSYLHAAELHAANLAKGGSL